MFCSCDAVFYDVHKRHYRQACKTKQSIFLPLNPSHKRQATHRIQYTRCDAVSLGEQHQVFRKIVVLHSQGQAEQDLLTLNMNAQHPFQISGIFHPTTQRHIPDDLLPQRLRSVCRAVTQVVGLSPRRPDFNARLVQVSFVVHRVAHLGCTLAVTFHQCITPNHSTATDIV